MYKDLAHSRVLINVMFLKPVSLSCVRSGLLSSTCSENWAAWTWQGLWFQGKAAPTLNEDQGSVGVCVCVGGGGGLVYVTRAHGHLWQPDEKPMTPFQNNAFEYIK